MWTNIKFSKSVNNTLDPSNVVIDFLPVKKPSVYFCKTGSLEWDEKYDQNIHNCSNTIHGRANEFYTLEEIAKFTGHRVDNIINIQGPTGIMGSTGQQFVNIQGSTGIMGSTGQQFVNIQGSTGITGHRVDNVINKQGSTGITGHTLDNIINNQGPTGITSHTVDNVINNQGSTGRSKCTIS